MRRYPRRQVSPDHQRSSEHLRLAAKLVPLCRPCRQKYHRLFDRRGDAIRTNAAGGRCQSTDQAGTASSADRAAGRSKVDRSARRGQLHHRSSEEGGGRSRVARCDRGADPGGRARRPHDVRACRRHAGIEPRSRSRVYEVRENASLGTEKTQEGPINLPARVAAGVILVKMTLLVSPD